MGLDDCDAFSKALSETAGSPIPARIKRQRAQFRCDGRLPVPLGGARVGIAADTDLLSAVARFLVSMAADVVAAVTSSRADRLSDPIDSVVIGDLADLEWLSRERGAELIVANSHGVEMAKRLRTALPRRVPDLRQLWLAVRAPFSASPERAGPCSRSRTFLAGEYQEIKPYGSRYSPARARH